MTVTAAAHDRPCLRQDCKNPGEWLPVLQVRAHYHHPPAEIALAGLVCVTHKVLGIADDYLSEDEWAGILDMLRVLHLGDARRELTTLVHERPDTARARALLAWRPRAT